MLGERASSFFQNLLGRPPENGDRVIQACNLTTFKSWLRKKYLSLLVVYWILRYAWYFRWLCFGYTVVMVIWDAAVFKDSMKYLSKVVIEIYESPILESRSCGVWDFVTSGALENAVVRAVSLVSLFVRRMFFVDVSSGGLLHASGGPSPSVSGSRLSALNAHTPWRLLKFESEFQLRQFMMFCSSQGHNVECPITKDIIVEPVVASDGYTYERCAIEAYLSGCSSPTSPLTRAFMNKLLIPNRLYMSNLDVLRKQFNDYYFPSS